MLKKVTYFSIILAIATTGLCVFGNELITINNSGSSGHTRSSAEKTLSELSIDTNDFVITPPKYPFKYYTSKVRINKNKTKFENLI